MLNSLTDSQTSIPAWYCARTQPKHEHIAAGGVRTRLGLEVFNPRLRVQRVTQRGVVNAIEPLFPSYIFVRCDLGEQFDAIRHVNGISSLVHFGHKIPTVPNAAIVELRQCFESDEPIAVMDSLQPGAEVVVGAGPFLGARGLVVCALEGRQRVQILLDFLGRSTLAEVERKSLKVETRHMANLIPVLAAEPPCSDPVSS